MRIRPKFAIVLAGLAAAAIAAPAGAATSALTGTQTPVDPENGTYAMHGSLVGAWSTLTFDELATAPLYRAKGTELFAGCLDRGRDGSCAGDPSGKLRIRFRYWAEPARNPAGFAWGACVHVITGGTRDFARAHGVLVMADAPVGDEVLTNYAGTLVLPDAAGSRHRARSSSLRAPAVTPAAPRGCVAG